MHAYKSKCRYETVVVVLEEQMTQTPSTATYVQQ